MVAHEDEVELRIECHVFHPDHVRVIAVRLFAHDRQAIDTHESLIAVTFAGYGQLYMAHYVDVNILHYGNFSRRNYFLEWILKCASVQVEPSSRFFL